MDNALSERAQNLLRALVRQYIHDGQPVGSKTLARASNLELSPATIRNIMAELEDLGFVESPHTSAGRVPTIQGYRYFVDCLLTMKPLAEGSFVDHLKSELGSLKKGLSHQEMLTSVSEYLSGVTHLAGIVTLPQVQRFSLKQLEFIPLSDRRVLAILVSSDQGVQNRILHVNRDFPVEDLRQLANFFNAHFAGSEMHTIRQRLVAQMQRDHEDMNQLMRMAVEMAENLFQEEKQQDFVMAGQVNLMEFQELSNIEQLRSLFEAFNRKRDILHLLDQCIQGQGVQIFIGRESGYQIFDHCSVVTSTYSVDGDVLGVLGVIGPTRMPYDRVIPIVDITAKLLGAALNSKN